MTRDEIKAELMRHNINDILAMLVDILAGDATPKGTLGGLEEVRAIRDRRHNAD